MSKLTKKFSVDDLRDILNRNGWLWVYDRECEEDFSYYQMTFQSYCCRTIVRVLFSKPESEGEEWDYSIVSLEAKSAEDVGPFFHRDVIGGMLQACQFAEDNLLAIGVPFGKNYRFQGRNIANKKRRNAALRRRCGLE